MNKPETCLKCRAVLVRTAIKKKRPWLLSKWSIALFSLLGLGGDLAFQRGHMDELLGDLANLECPNCNSKNFTSENSGITKQNHN